ncbi:hypothetical protein K2173_014470 [Erythroxylum novogranatense]|uniref:Uncharacterized protein n=1 Tax=Erythroxylum novogranatense TaxID=1862640 RepID=A0AAV8S6D2_9ROSI|nr:hypothetical protein K2173_014470 [Erythroxylum novogranatense]
MEGDNGDNKGDGEIENGSSSGLTTDWSELTHECLINILSRLNLEQRWRGPLFVCKSWLGACKDPTLHTTFDLESLFDSSAESRRWWSPDFERKIDFMLLSALNHFLACICRCPNLQVLSIKSSPNVTDLSMLQIAFNCTKLQELDINYCYEISYESLVTVGRNCPNLKVLKRNLMNWLDPSQHTGIVPIEYLNACPQDGDSEAGAVGKFMPRLQHLELQFSKLSAKGLALICEGCLDLEFLDLHGCANLTSRAIVSATSNLKNLKEIKKPNFYIPRSSFNAERYGHWNLYDDRFQTNVFNI